MGSLASRPKAPMVVQQPVYVPVSTVPMPASSPSGNGATPSTPVSTASVPDTAAQARELGLLERQRGILGTVLTGFRGILNQGINTAQRKTLLGE